MAFQRPTKEEARAIVSDLVTRYSPGAANAERPGSDYLESQLRLDFIDSFLRAFGWDVSNEDGKVPSRRDVVVENRTDIGDDEESIGRPDYTMRYDGHPKHVVEAKKPSVRLNQPKPARQARTYGWSLALPVAVVTNFSETVFYDARVEPNPEDGVSVAELPDGRFSYTKYVDRFDRLWDLLSFDSVQAGRYEEIYDYVEPPRGQSGFDQAFLAQLRWWRSLLAADIAANNPGLGGEEIGRRTQRLLNALVFLRVCEDRNIERYQDLLDAARTSQLVERFRSADSVYNAGLFSVLDETTVDPETLRTIVGSLYWPYSKYAFGLIQPDILASIYEQFLGERVEVSEDRTVSLVRKPELTHTGGVVPTPDFIVQSLLRDTLTPQLEQADFDRLQTVTVLDMACGSGVFLVGAFALLLARYEELCGSLTVHNRVEISRLHLHGVDLDPEAVEVTRLSILLAILGDDQIDITHEHSVLPDLSNNVVVGNSVVDLGFDARFPDAAKDPLRRVKVKPFSWAEHFPDVLATPGASERGFDVIVGNPPYQRIQTLAQFLPDELAFLQDPRSHFTSSVAFNFDVYMVFVEQGLRLLKSGTGRLGFIVPNRLMRSPPGADLREALGKRVDHIVDFGTCQIFHGRTTYTCLLIVGDGSDPLVPIATIDDLTAWRAGVAPAVQHKPRTELGRNPWTYGDDEALFRKVRDHCPRVIDDVAKVFVGVQTSADDIFLVQPAPESTDEIVVFVDANGQRREIERSITQPAIRDRTLVPYDCNPVPDAVAIFPYEINSSGRRPAAVVLNSADIFRDYPKTAEYLAAFEDRLKGRSVTPDPGESYWAYGRSQSLTKLDPPKIIVRVLSLEPQYALDTRGLVVPGGGDGGPYYLLRPTVDWEHSVEVLIALLSHPVIDSIVATEGRHYRGGYFVHRKAYLVGLPVPTISAADGLRITELVREMHGHVQALRDQQDSEIVGTTRARMAWLRTEIEDILSRSLGLDPDYNDGSVA
jgi:methylase of polypeptide subunit release factors